MRTPKQFNNITERVIDDLKQVLSSGNSQISIAAASFSIYAYEALKEELEKVDCVNFIFTSPTFYTDKSEKQKREFYIPKLNRERSLFGSDFEIRLRNQLTQRAIARECADWIRRKARFKTNITHGSMNTFLSIKEGEETYTYMPFNEFTTTELGLDRGNNICPMVVGMPGHNSTDMFLKNFAELWDIKLQQASNDNKQTIKNAISLCDKLHQKHLLSKVAIERIRRAGKKIREDNKDKEGIEKLDTGFRVLKLDSSNMEDVYYTPQEFTMQSLFNENVKADRTGEDLLFQVMLDLGIELSAKIETQQIAGKTVYLVDDNYLVACFDRDVTEATITEIAKLHPIYFVMRDASAANDNVIDNFEQLFEAYSKDTVRKIL